MSLEKFSLADTTNNWDYTLILLLYFLWPEHFHGLSLEIHYHGFFFLFFYFLNVPVVVSRVQNMSCSIAGQSKPKYLRSEFDPQVEIGKIWSDVTILTEMTIRKSLNLQVAITGVYLFIFSTALLSYKKKELQGPISGERNGVKVRKEE